MKDKLEEYVSQNRDAFDEEQPSQRVWEALEKEFAPVKKEKVRLLSDWRWMSAAAVLLFALSSVLYVLNLSDDTKIEPEQMVQETDPIELPAVINDLDELYKTQRVSTFDALQHYPEARQDIQQELSELDSEFELLRQDLGEGISNEAVLEAMIENYRVKLDVLESTLEHIKRNSKNIKTPEDESFI